jgi:DNA polymerase I
MASLYLLDGTALAFRAHFAFAASGLLTAAGQPTGATFGFAMTLKRLIEKERPDKIAVAFDAKGENFRHQRYAEYKATRERAPEELLAQLEWMRRLVKAFGIALFEIPGVEADDVIGTLAVQGALSGDQVRIVTGDKDLMQLIGLNIELYNVFKEGVDVLIQGADQVREKFGCTPEQVIEVLAIMGDASDNVPGVRGIGEKGAIKLIQTYGSVEGVLAHLDDLTPKLREKIEADRENLLLSRELVTIHSDLPLHPGLESIGPARPETKLLRELYRELGFRSLLEGLEKSSEESEVPRDYHTIHDLDELDTMEAELRRAGCFALDSETTGLDPLTCELVGLSFSSSPGRAFYVPFNAFPPVHPAGSGALLKRLTGLLTDPGLRRFGQNTKYDWQVLSNHGVQVPPPDFDTLLASFLAAGNGRSHGLDALALHFFGLEKIPTKDLIGTGQKQITMKEVPIEQVAEYACEDADVTFRLREPLERELDQEAARPIFETLELPLVPVLLRMEARGIRLDQSLLQVASKELGRELGELEEQLYGLAGEVFKLNSPKALGHILFDKLSIHTAAGVKQPRRTQTGYSTDAATLEEHYGDVPIVVKLLEYRELSKLKSTYVDALPRYVNPRTGRVHCSFSQVSAATGRLASSEPNLQNIPVRTARGRRLREAFVPRIPDQQGEWVLLSADYSQIELRVMAHLSGDEQLAAAFRAGADIHAATASTLFGVAPEAVDRTMRSQAKVINFGLLYGMGPQRVARETGLSVPEAKRFIERYFESFPSVRAWMDGLLATARQKGFVETILGRRRRTPDLDNRNSRLRSFAENAAINTPVQGSAADIIKRAMLVVEAELKAAGLAAEMLLQVHDELLFEVPLAEVEAARRTITRCMEQALPLSVPLVVECGFGKNWLEAH